MMDRVIKDLSLRYYKDIRVIKTICEHPLLFAKRKIEDPTNLRAIMIRYLGKFVPKHRKTIEGKQRNYERYVQSKINRGNS